MSKQNDEIGTFTRASRLLRKTELTCDEANELTEIISEMAGSKAESRYESLEKQVSNLRWFIAVGIALAGVLAALLN